MIRFTIRSAAHNSDVLARQPDFWILWMVSIFHRIAYRRDFHGLRCYLPKFYRNCKSGNARLSSSKPIEACGGILGSPAEDFCLSVELGNLVDWGEVAHGICRVHDDQRALTEQLRQVR